MDIVAATFAHAEEAASAASGLALELHVEPDLMTVAAFDDLAPDVNPDDLVAARSVLVAWVPEDRRSLARDTIGRHHGHHVPLDWVLTKSRRIAAHIFLLPGSGGTDPALSP